MQSLLSPVEKRVLGLLYDWPWISQGDLAGILGVSQSRTSQLVARLTICGMATTARVGRRRRLNATDDGLALLARRDRTSVLVVLRDDVASTHFLRVAQEEMDRTGVEVQLSVSHEAALEDLGPLGLAWCNPRVNPGGILARP